MTAGDAQSYLVSHWPLLTTLVVTHASALLYPSPLFKRLGAYCLPKGFTLMPTTSYTEGFQLAVHMAGTFGRALGFCAGFVESIMPGATPEDKRKHLIVLVQQELTSVETAAHVPQELIDWTLDYTRLNRLLDMVESLKDLAAAEPTPAPALSAAPETLALAAPEYPSAEHASIEATPPEAATPEQAATVEIAVPAEVEPAPEAHIY